MGRTVGPGVRRFVETGDTEIIEQERDTQYCYNVLRLLFNRVIP